MRSARRVPSLRNEYHLHVCDPVQPGRPLSIHGRKKEAEAQETHLDRLTSKGIDGACRSYLKLVENHVTEALVIHNADVDVRCKFLASDARVHGLVAIIVVSCCDELFTKIIDRPVLFREPRSSQMSVRWGRTL